MKKVQWLKMPVGHATEVVHETEEFSAELAILKMYWLAARDGDRTTIVNGEERALKYNQFLTSASQLAKDWKWNRECVYRFLYALSSGYTEYIEVEELAGHDDPLIITMLRYDEFVVTA